MSNLRVYSSVGRVCYTKTARKVTEDARQHASRKDSMTSRTVWRKVHKLTKLVHLHQILGAIIIVAHASEILRVVSHISIWHLLIAGILFALWLIPESQHSELA